MRSRRPRSPSNTELNAAHRFYASLSDREPAIIRRTNVKRVHAAGDPSEHQIQAAVIKWWNLACRSYGLPDYALYAVPNGARRDAITGARLKAEGVRRGIPDLVLAARKGNYGGLYLELKTRSGTTSTEQRDRLHYLAGQGYDISVQHSVDGAIAAIKQYLSQR